MSFPIQVRHFICYRLCLMFFITLLAHLFSATHSPAYKPGGACRVIVGLYDVTASRWELNVEAQQLVMKYMIQQPSSIIISYIRTVSH